MKSLKYLMFQFVRLFLTEIRIQADPVHGVRLSLVYAKTGESLDHRIKKIDVARESLADALKAMDELKEQAEENKTALNTLSNAVEKAESDKLMLSEELATIRQLSILDTKVVQRALGVPTRLHVWMERVISFFVGCAASLMASWLWQFLG